MEGSKVTEITRNIMLACISEEANDLLDQIMLDWALYEEQLKGNFPDYEPTHYGFAYWLVRYSGLIRPA